MGNNENFNKAKREKNDEFYTQFSDIKRELEHYREHFKDKTVYLNCDSENSSFWKYFKLNFDFFGLNRLIATHYSVCGDAYKLEMLGKGDITKTVLTQNGDFRSSECIELLKEADIIVTNPPFSLFREYIPQLMEHNKKFLIVGPIGAVLYKYISKCIKDNELWLGKNRIKEFKQLDGSIKKFGNIHWFTNLEYDDKKAELNLTHEYSLAKYPKYDNYDAINVNRVAEIPKNYYGAVGVPITYLIKHNPDQFEIVKFMTGDDGKDLKVNGKRPYTRMIIRRISKK